MVHISHESRHGPRHGPHREPHHEPEARRWQDWANMAFGILLASSPWLLGYSGLEAATMNAVIVGFLIFALSALALTLLDRWEAYISAMLGLWAGASPWLLGFTGYDGAMIAHLGVGICVVTVASVEIWQGDRRD
ncbi:MAG: SPW repeat protein [Ferrovibrio sp.]|uniref:SPW repeat protein n=1 Tax=Ferrovibrio sp. TaxID=1917215 RepID=UPI00391A4B3D